MRNISIVTGRFFYHFRKTLLSETTHHGQHSHQVYRYRVLLHPLCNQFHQQHEHVVDSLMNLCAPFVYGTAGQ